MADYVYRYEWDTTNRKKVYRGKYPSVLGNSGYYGSGEAGNKRYFASNEAGIPREFVGSDSQEYTFFDVEHGVNTIVARSFPEALRIAESRGYTRSDYVSRKRKRGKS